MNENVLLQQVRQLGADQAAILDVALMPFEPRFRQMCKQNACGMYGRNWMCPPDVGPIETLIAGARCYKRALVYQIVTSLEDCYDFEGMLEAGRRINLLSRDIRQNLSACFGPGPLYLGAGACRACERCTKMTGQPCRAPEQAMPSMESYGLDVSRLAELCGMRYINGPDTVTYFGTVLFRK